MTEMKRPILSGGCRTQSRRSTPRSERAQRKAPNDAAPRSERADRKRLRGPGWRHTFGSGLWMNAACKPVTNKERAHYVGMA